MILRNDAEDHFIKKNTSHPDLLQNIDGLKQEG